MSLKSKRYLPIGDVYNNAIMKQNPLHISAFTLVEILVAMSILAIMMVSILSVFLFSSQMSHLVDLNRVTQENMKNVLEDISESIRKDGIIWVRDFSDSNCADFSQNILNSESGSTLCLIYWEYTLWYKNATWDFLPVQDVSSYCGDIQNVCYIIKKDYGGDWYPLTNSFLSFQKMDFILLNPDLPKLSLLLEARPAIGKGITPEVIEKNVIRVQTTLTERLIETN